MPTKDIITLTKEYTKSKQRSVTCLRVSSSDVKVGQSAEGLSMYALLLIIRGTITITYREQDITFKVGDLHLYSPEMSTRMLASSSDYEAYLLMMEDKFIAQHASLNYIFKATYLPIITSNQPKLTLKPTQVRLLSLLFEALMSQYKENNTYHTELLKHYSEIIVLNLRQMVEQHFHWDKRKNRSEELFIEFLRLVPLNARIHHDIAFYAKQLHITPTYLSRIVHKLSGQTAKYFIEYNLINEAILMLQHSNKSIKEIAWALHFSDQSSFTKFFRRSKGVSPLFYRKQL